MYGKENFLKKQVKNIVPVLLGGDLNAYSVALAFREAFGVLSHAFVRYRCGATERSSFIKTHLCSELDDPRVAVPELLKFAYRHSGQDLYLIPCADWYVNMLERAKNVLSGIYKIHVPETDTWKKLSDKHTFYLALKDFGIPYPEYEVFMRGEKPSAKKLSRVEYPAVLKPSDSTEYWMHKFDGMEKVYFPKSSAEAAVTICKIINSGYNGNIILQKKIGEGKDNRVLTTFSDEKGSVVRAVLGQVILEEIGKTSMGNHSAIITRPLDKISFALIDFLNKQKYKGIANIDIIADSSGVYALELNPRQGRSCDYLRAAGVNIAELLVKVGEKEAIQPKYDYREVFWHYPSDRTVRRFAYEPLKFELETICDRGDNYSPYKNEYEKIRRKVYVFIHSMRLDGTFRKDAQRREK